jgi:uncharacterized membrane protein (DUF2068 family)
MFLKIGAVFLVFWGFVNALGGALRITSHPAPGIAALFIVVGVLIAAGGVGFWQRRPWGAAVSLVGLVGLSAVAVVSGYILHGPGQMRVSHHLVRLLISTAFFLVAWLGSKQAPEERAKPQHGLR